MSPEEFKKKFKVGDEIQYSGWLPNREEEITAIGKEMFLSIDKGGLESENPIVRPLGEWIKPPKKVEQDLADCFEAVQVIPSYNQMYCRLVFVNSSEFDDNQDRHKSHLITIEEAKARGLKINR